MNVQIILSQVKKQKDTNIQISLAELSYDIKDDQKIDQTRLVNTIANTIYRRLEKKEQGIKTGITLTRPVQIKVITDGTTCIDLEKLRLRSGLDSTIKINARKYKEDRNASKALFTDTISYVFTEAKQVHEEFMGIFS